MMADEMSMVRQLPEGFVEKTYIRGFLNDGVYREIEYGCVARPLPKTSGRKRWIASSIDAALAPTPKD